MPHANDDVAQPRGRAQRSGKHSTDAQSNGRGKRKKAKQKLRLTLPRFPISLRRIPLPKQRQLLCVGASVVSQPASDPFVIPLFYATQPLSSFSPFSSQGPRPGKPCCCWLRGRQHISAGQGAKRKCGIVPAWKGRCCRPLQRPKRCHFASQRSSSVVASQAATADAPIFQFPFPTVQQRAQRCQQPR